MYYSSGQRVSTRTLIARSRSFFAHRTEQTVPRASLNPASVLTRLLSSIPSQGGVAQIIPFSRSMPSRPRSPLPIVFPALMSWSPTLLTANPTRQPTRTGARGFLLIHRFRRSHYCHAPSRHTMVLSTSQSQSVAAFLSKTLQQLILVY